MAFVAMRHLDFGEVVAEAGTLLDGVERFSAFRGLYGSGAVVPDNDPRAPEISGQLIKFGVAGQIEKPAKSEPERESFSRSGRTKKHGG